MLGFDEDDVTLNSSLNDDLEMHPLDLVELWEKLEETMGFELSDEDQRKSGVQMLKTVGDVTNFLSHRILGGAPMIDEDRAMAMLKEACPAVPDEDLEYEGKGARVNFMDMGVFAHHIVDAHSAGTTERFQAFFEVLESMIVHGYSQVRGLAVYGLIEDIQNIASKQPHGYAVFEPWLRPASKEAWQELRAIWQGRASLADMLRAERQGEVQTVSRVLQTKSR